MLYVSPLLKGEEVRRETADFRAKVSIQDLNEGKIGGMNERHIELTIGRNLTDEEKEVIKMMNGQKKLLKTTMMRLIFEAKGRGFSEGYRIKKENYSV